MPAPNSITSALVVYGSFAPGGVDHHKLGFLPGVWVKGGVHARPAGKFRDVMRGFWRGEPDCHQVQFGGIWVMPAWMIKFADDSNLHSWDEGYAEWNHVQRERWKQLDAIFGEEMRRVSEPWWPASGPRQSYLVNIYQSIALHPKVYKEDPIHPDDKHDTRRLWDQTVRGERRYETYTFMGFINDLDPSEFEDVFGQLPHSEGFIEKLRMVFEEQTEEGSEHPSLTPDGRSRYVIPIKGSLTDGQILELVRQDVERRLAFVLAHEPQWVESEVDQIAKLRYEFGTPPAGREDDDLDLRDHYGDLIIKAEPDDHWFGCLAEACYTIATSNELRDWLLADWLIMRPAGLEIGYVLWQENISYLIQNGVCRVYRD